MKTQIIKKWWHRQVWRNDEGVVNRPKAPVQEADDNLDRRGDESEVVLKNEAILRVGYVCDQTKSEACCTDCDANYGKELKMPAKRLILSRC